MTISLANQMKRIPCIREKTQIKKPLHYAEAFHLSQTYNVFRDYPPKLSYISYINIDKSLIFKEKPTTLV